MRHSGLTGSRIRERRLLAGLKQVSLARRVGISAAYLNLIEFNRRNIAGKLLSDIAGVLGVETGVLAEGAEAGLVMALRDAAAGTPQAGAEVQRVDEFAGRFTGWAGLVAAQHARIGGLERSFEALSDRMAHDPHLAASLHELLSMVTAISATAAILVAPEPIEDEWRDRFQRNIHEDSQRLAESSRALVAYLEAAAQSEPVAGLPLEELELWLQARDFHVAGLEASPAVRLEDLLRDAPEISSAAASALVLTYLRRYAEDAARMPMAEFSAAVDEAAFDPGALAQQFAVDIAAVMRRIAALPTPGGAGRIGLVVCDGAGAMTFRKPGAGFSVPRYGAACPLWPLYQALSRPMVPLRAVVEMAGRDAERFLVYAIAQPAGPPGFDVPTVFEATMLVLPVDRVAMPDLPVVKVGTSCRICPRADCPARREVSILSETSTGAPRPFERP